MATIKVKNANNEWQSVAIANTKTIEVPVEPIIESIEITENGTYEASGGVDGYNPIIVNVPSSGGGGLPAEALTITGMCDYKFSGNGWNWFINTYGSQITTNNITSSQYMFFNNHTEEFPFTLNFQQGTPISAQYMFQSSGITKLPTVNNFLVNNISGMFENCHKLREINQEFLDGIDYSYIENATNFDAGISRGLFSCCYSLRSVPMEFVKRTHNPIGDPSWMYLSIGFQNCFALDELVNLPITEGGVSFDWDIFYATFAYCRRLKNLTFETKEDGTAKVMNWCGQAINLGDDIGWSDDPYWITGYNSGITADKQVKDDATYQALKDDPDWFSCDVNYSRYNKTSAVATINSLPDTSAYVTEMGSPNMITFNGAAGALTDGGAINTMTEAEIAVAAAKGWTVSLV